MLARVFSGATVGLESVPIEGEVDISAKGLPAFTIVGLPDKAIEEAKERIRSAIRNSGLDFPVASHPYGVKLHAVLFVKK